MFGTLELIARMQDQERGGRFIHFGMMGMKCQADSTRKPYLVSAVWHKIPCDEPAGLSLLDISYPYYQSMPRGATLKDMYGRVLLFLGKMSVEVSSGRIGPWLLI